jgi:hypothetical protein
MNKRRRARRSRRAARPIRRGKTLALVGVAAAVIAVASIAGFLMLRPGEPPGPPKAAIVDQLSLTAPNPAFAQKARTILKEGGYEVDYFAGEWVTVDFYRDLPKRDYDLLIMRTHAGRWETGGRQTDVADLFTSELYSPERYVEEQRDGRLRIAVYDAESPEYFSVTADFVRASMGGLDGATVILMGCDVLAGEALASAFVAAGAGAVVGWNETVSADHTDLATLSFLRHHLAEALPVDEAVSAAMDEVGRDPVYHASLLAYLAAD